MVRDVVFVLLGIHHQCQWCAVLFQYDQYLCHFCRKYLGIIPVNSLRRRIHVHASWSHFYCTNLVYVGVTLGDYSGIWTCTLCDSQFHWTFLEPGYLIHLLARKWRQWYSYKFNKVHFVDLELSKELHLLQDPPRIWQ